MASTNKTTNYELSQFLGSDKPAWLSDYNTDMSKIDTAIKNASDTATSASGSSSANTTAIGTLANLTTTAKTDLVSAVNEVNTVADTAQNTANSASSSATTANTKADNLTAQFNMSVIKEDSDLNFTSSAGSINDHNVKFVTNSDGSLAKVYGTISLTNIAGTGNMTVTITGTGLTLDEPIHIQSHGYLTSTVYQLDQTQQFAVLQTGITLSTNTITITLSRNANMNQRYIMLSDALIFLKDFGDVVIPQ